MCAYRKFTSKSLSAASNQKRSVFGRVVHGFEHIEAVGKLPTDSRDRPLSPVVITHCGELELRRPAAAATRERSVSGVSDRSDSRSPPRRRRRRSRRSGSDDDASGDSDDSEAEEERRRRKRERRERKLEKREKREDKDSRRKDKKPREETEEELDAR